MLTVSIKTSSYKFLVTSLQAADWYDPPRPHALVEYDWILNNLNMEGARVIDAGAHHGHYSLLFAMARPGPDIVYSVEPDPSNCAVLEANAALNRAPMEIVSAAVSSARGFATFLPRGNGRLFPGVGIEVPTVTLRDIDPLATIIKLDIEGSEFELLPDQIDTMPAAHTWILEVHPRYGDPHQVASSFIERGYRASYLDRDRLNILPYFKDAIASRSTSIFLQR
jgi:FkbM family methyltransferase